VFYVVTARVFGSFPPTTARPLIFISLPAF